MIDEVLQTYTGFLTHPTTGVNALLPSVPREAGEVAPAAVAIVDETTAAWVAREAILQEKLSAVFTVILSQGGDVATSLFAERSRPSPGVPVLIRIAVKGSDTKLILHQARQILRCVKRAIAVQYDSPATSRTPARHQVNIDPPGALIEGPPFIQVDGDILVLPLLITVPALDTWALAITT